MSDIITKLKFFHGTDYSEGKWCATKYECCSLCKTRSNTDKHRHWSHGLCRSCYRRLSLMHRLYNDKWAEGKTESKESQIKKEYKTLLPEEINFDPTDIESLLERYNFKCAYCWRDLQGHDHTSLNSLNIEYLRVQGKFELVPVCKSCNCSKKNINDELKLKRWAKERGLKYPFNYIHPIIK